MKTPAVFPIGQDAARIDVPAKVTGAALYPGDIARPDMLHMATLFAGRPHARVLVLTQRRQKPRPAS